MGFHIIQNHKRELNRELLCRPEILKPRHAQHSVNTEHQKPEVHCVEIGMIALQETINEHSGRYSYDYLRRSAYQGELVKQNGIEIYESEPPLSSAGEFHQFFDRNAGTPSAGTCARLLSPKERGGGGEMC